MAVQVTHRLTSSNTAVAANGGPVWGGTPIYGPFHVGIDPGIQKNDVFVVGTMKTIDGSGTLQWPLPIPVSEPTTPFEAIDPAVEVRARRNAKKLDTKISFYGARKQRSDGRRGFRLVGTAMDVHIWLEPHDDWDSTLRAYAL